VAALARTTARLGREGSWAGRALLRAFSQIVLSDDRVTAGLLVAAAASSPAALAGGVTCALAALATARAMALDGVAEGGGAFGANALFLGLAVGNAAGVGGMGVALALGFGVVAAFVVAAGTAILSRGWALPVLSVPSALLVLLLRGVAASGLGAPAAAVIAAPSPGGPAALFESLGALVFAPAWPAGLLVAAAVLWHSRIAFSLVMLAGTLLLWLGEALGVGAPATRIAVFNGCLTAVALGGVWFVPSPSSFLLGLGGALATGLLAWGLARPWQTLGWPLSVLPFNAATLLLLVACRTRLHDRRPKAVDFRPGTPEQNLAAHELWLRRGLAAVAPGAVTFQLPFGGEWLCTQGVEGALTHKGLWRHAFDFEIADAGGKLHRGDGRDVGDYHCYGVPVLATADGTVVRVVSDVPDNAVGTINVRHNWGNVVLLWHAPGLYSLVAHLQPGSATVREGQNVIRGEVLGACGSSGRSPRPHVHFQLQGSPVVGAPTVPCAFGVATEGDAAGGLARRAAVPAEGERWANPKLDENSHAAFDLPLGRTWYYQLEGPTERWERVSVEVDLLGELALVSEMGRLAFRRTGHELVTTTGAAAPESVLDLMRIAVPSVSMGTPGQARWLDWLPSAHRGGRRAPWRDFVAPFIPDRGVDMIYGLERLESGLLVIAGRSVSRDGRRAPPVETRAYWAPGNGVVRLEVATAVGLRRARRASVPVLVPSQRREENGHESRSGGRRAGDERACLPGAAGGPPQARSGPPTPPSAPRDRVSP
jgi:murein DD-endopeptidase MepM/ murein hydrolase activator NlpD